MSGDGEIVYRFVCLSDDASAGGRAPGGSGTPRVGGGRRFVELPDGLPASRWVQVGEELAGVLEVDEGDLCFYRLVRTAGGYAASEANGLVADFKLDPALYRGRPEVWRHKLEAVGKFAGAVARLLERPDFQGAIGLFGGAAIVPAPTHRPKSHEHHDPRLSDLCAQVAGRVEGVRLEDAFDVAHATEPAHLGGTRDVAALKRGIAFGGFSRPARLVVLVDDVLTRGSHFAACRDLIRERYPGATVVGVFLAIHKSEFVEYPVEL